jgi:xylulokinase
MSVTERIPRATLIQITGNRPATGFWGPSLLWLRAHEPEHMCAIAQLLLPKDYLTWRMTGQRATDVSDASGTGMLDLHQRSWATAVVDAVGADPTWFPPVFESVDIVGRLSRDAAAEMGLAAGVAVVAGGGDTHTAALAMGADRPGRTVITIGSAEQVFVPTAQPVIDPHGRLHSLCHCVPDTWHVMAAHLNGGLALTWVASLFPEVSLDTLIAEAARVPAGCDGLVFTPYLLGERTPVFDPNVRGGFSGLSVMHTRGHLIRAVMEGVALTLRDSLALMDALGLGQGDVRCATGGAFRIALWRQIIESAIGSPLMVSETNGSAFGAALLALKALDGSGSARFSGSV